MWGPVISRIELLSLTLLALFTASRFLLFSYSFSASPCSPVCHFLLSVSVYSRSRSLLSSSVSFSDLGFLVPLQAPTPTLPRLG